MTTTRPASTTTSRPQRVHPALVVAAVTFVALLGAAAFRAAPSVLMVPLEEEFGWSRGVLSSAVGLNLVLFGLTAPFAAALMERFGIRRVVASALVLVALGSGLTVLVTSAWQLVLLWGVLVGLGTGSMALVLAATIASRWFVRRRGLVMGLLTAGSTMGQLIFLPVVAEVASRSGWRAASLVIAGTSLAVIPLVLLLLHDRPQDRGVLPYGATPDDATPDDVVPDDAVPDDAVPDDATPDDAVPASGRPTGGAAGLAITTLREAARHRTFWALAVGFAICGATTNGLIGTHLVPAAHDHGMGTTTAAGLLAVVGIFDLVGTLCSGYLTDRVNPRLLLAVYYALRGVGLVMLPLLLTGSVHPSMLAFVVVYGLDWVATVPPTVALCREAFGARGTIVFGWVFASHQLGAAAAAVAAGAIRDAAGSYTIAWVGGAVMCVVAALVSVRIAPASARVAHAR